jgi:hypothetical protein
MTSQYAIGDSKGNLGRWIGRLGLDLPRRAVVAIILIVALFAFEIFNFDTTRYALTNLMGDIRFLGFQWAAILAIAFCSIDFAGLVRLFTPEKGRDEPKEVWYLMGAWLLGATMNALMTWWAVSLTLLNHEFGNEVLSRQQLLNVVPVFVAVLVWLTRILFIGAFTVAGEHIFDLREWRVDRTASSGQRARQRPARTVARRQRQTSRPAMAATGKDGPDFLEDHQPSRVPTSPAKSRSSRRPTPSPSGPRRQNNSRIRQRPPMPNGLRRMPLNGVQARRRN